MKAKNKLPKSRSTIVLYIASLVVFLMGVASLVMNIIYYNSLISTYVSEGYAYSYVASELLPSTLLPAIFEAIGLYFGIAFALFGIGMINNKLSVKSLIKDDNDNNTNSDNIDNKDNISSDMLSETNEEDADTLDKNN